MTTLQLVSISNPRHQIISNDNFAGGGVDYNSGPCNVTIPAEMTNVSFNVTVNNDDILEGDETFMLTITNLSSSEEGFVVTTGDHDKAVVTIIDTTSE